MSKRSYRLAGLLTLACLAYSPVPSTVRAEAPATDAASWSAVGWGGGGFYYAAAFHPTRDGVIYLSGDVNGIYKTEDHGKHWRIINRGIANYGVFSLAVDPSTPDTLYAATEGGLCKSTDAGETWTVLPGTDRKDLRITGEKGHSTRCIAVDPANSNIVYAGSPNGKIYKSADGGQTWAAVYEKKFAAETVDSVRVQFGKVNGAVFGGIWMPLAFPATLAPADATGFGFSFKAEGALPRDAFLTLKTADGTSYRSKNLHDLFSGKDWHDVVLTGADFVIDPEFKAKNPDKAAASPQTPDWSTVNRLDFSCVGGLETEASVGHFGRFFFAAKPAAGDQPTLVTARDFATDKKLQSYGNVRIGTPVGGSVPSMAVSPKDSSLVAAATVDSGLLLSEDAGQTWHEVDGPKKATTVAFAASDANLIYAGFGTDGVWKSADKGHTWAKKSAGIGEGIAVREIVVSPTNPQDVYAIGAGNWVGQFYASNDGGQTWTKSSQMKPDAAADPTLPTETAGDKTVGLSTPTNLAINPKNPQELFISANWRPAISEDGGKTWAESARGTDISCVTDIRFHKNNVYVSAMDEGVFSSDSNGDSWKQLWPLHFADNLSGHYWRLAVDTVDGADRIISASSPWTEKFNNQVVLSDDGGKTFKVSKAGLPNYLPTANTMWGRGYARALAIDPNHLNVVYMAIDGDATNGKSGGGIFKSEDGGETWKQLPNQPGSRRMYYGLAVDPTDSNRLYFATCGVNGGLYRSDDGGNSWKSVLANGQWFFNVMVTADGAVYCPGKDLFRSTDHGQTWKQISKFGIDGAIVGLERHPTDPNTIWASVTTWSGQAEGGVYKTTDGGATWKDITGDLPYRKPLVLRFNPATNELWAGGVGLYRVKQ